MNILNFNENLKSYTFPVVKIIGSIMLIIIMVNRNYFIHFNNIVFNIVVGVLCTAATIAGVFCIYLSWSEISLVHENRTKTNIVLDGTIANSKEYSVDEIISMARNNEIINIQIIANDKVIDIGSSSDCKAGSSEFFDKLYYVDKKEFADIEGFRASLLSYIINEKIMVISIDGIRPE